MTTETAVFGGGCFWCTEAIYQKLKGVNAVMPGYAGGETENPTYSQICGGSTGHAEVIQIEFNPDEISYEDLLKVFFAIHDPTTLNRQGNDVGPQYRSILLTTTAQQNQIAEQFIQNLKKSEFRGQTITTEIKPLNKFHPAEKEHLDYYERNRSQPYCQIIIDPKVEKFKQKFSELVK